MHFWTGQQLTVENRPADAAMLFRPRKAEKSPLNGFLPDADNDYARKQESETSFESNRGRKGPWRAAGSQDTTGTP
ncbi:hypothetical protein RP20_CCG004395 [Aedes albopictus]|nr:hypothetical protein RP20_CCG004395 [Aedes albopictus]